MDAKLDNLSEISKLLSIKSKMSSDNLSLFSKFGLDVYSVGFLWRNTMVFPLFN